MDGSQIIYVMIGFCLLAIVFIVFSKQLKFLLRVAANGAMGIIAIQVINALVGGVAVGVNFLTVLMVGVLGIPGLISLYIIQAIL